MRRTSRFSNWEQRCTKRCWHLSRLSNSLPHPSPSTPAIGLSSFSLFSFNEIRPRKSRARRSEAILSHFYTKLPGNFQAGMQESRNRSKRKESFFCAHTFPQSANSSNSRNSRCFLETCYIFLCSFFHHFFHCLDREGKE